MSQEKVLKTLESLGFTKSDAQVYIFLGKKGPQKAKDIAKALKMPKQTLYLVIKNLQSKGMITATLEHPSRFSAAQFEKVLDLFVKIKTEEVQRIEQGRKDLISDWQAITIAEVGDDTSKFAVIEGRNFIYPRLRQMIEETKNQLLVVSTVPGLTRAEQYGLFDAAFSHASKTNTNLRFLTELSNENLKATKLLLGRMHKAGLSFEGRTPELGLKLVSRMLIRDDAEAAFFISQAKDKTTGGADELCLWTNSRAIVDSFKAVFEDLWQNSLDVEKRIVEIEAGKPTTKTCVISDSVAAKKKYEETMAEAEEEIVILTSSAGLYNIWKNIRQLKDRAEKGVHINIMAPITSGNFEAALHLSACCNVRHVPACYLRTTAVDRKHLFQFKNPPLEQEKGKGELSFENTIYTNDPEYVEKTRKMLDDVWKHSCAPSAVTLKEIIKPPMLRFAPVLDDEYVVSKKDSPYQKIFDFGIEERQGVLTEEHVLNKIINAKRKPVKNPLKDIVRLYGSQASAVIHTPNSFGIPDMLLTFYHCNKQSSFGAEDFFYVDLWLKTSKGHFFVPVAAVGDNAKELEIRKLHYARTPAGKNCHLVRKDELQIQVHGNTLFAGWTVPIPLFPPKYTLPPASVLFEGYGKLKSGLFTFTLPSGAKSIFEGNGFDAFVTFFHPASKYAGPGTDGMFGRDMILTGYPPPTKLKTNSP